MKFSMIFTLLIGVMAPFCHAVNLDPVQASYSGDIVGNKFDQKGNSLFFQDLKLAQKFNIDHQVSLKIRTAITDNTKEDVYKTIDPRITYQYNVGKISAKQNISVYLLGEVPISQASMEEDKLWALRPGITYIHNLDDYNTFVADLGLHFKNTENETKSSALPYFSYTNTALSEKHKFRVDFEGSLSSKQLNRWANDRGNERFLVGVETQLSSWSTYPYLSHDPSLAKAFGLLGLGIQASGPF